jgi:hypothetical protein
MHESKAIFQFGQRHIYIPHRYFSTARNLGIVTVALACIVRKFAR